MKKRWTRLALLSPSWQRSGRGGTRYFHIFMKMAYKEGIWDNAILSKLKMMINVWVFLPIRCVSTAFVSPHSAEKRDPIQKINESKKINVFVDDGGSWVFRSLTICTVRMLTSTIAFPSELQFDSSKNSPSVKAVSWLLSSVDSGPCRKW